jgi:CubicO group peptidase (beta-lactamase class C family)
MRPALMLAAFALFLSSRSAGAADCATSAATAWPTQTWRDSLLPPSPAVEALDAYLFPADGERRTDGVLVVRDDAVVYERYANGFGPEKRHIAWSMTKSVLHAVYGTAVQRGLVDVDRPVAERSPWIGGGEKARITYRDLLRMSSGLAFREQYEFAPINSSVLAMLYTVGRGDMARYAAGHELAAAPGERWSYSSGDSLILAAALRDVVGAEAYPDYPWTALFDPLGMRSAVWERDGSGTFVGSSYLYATARDLAKIGLLYLEDGCWEGRRLLPEGWVGAAADLAPALEGSNKGPWWRPWVGLPEASYGEHWWLNRPAGDEGEQRVPGAATDMLIATGHWGQRLFVLPGRRVVAVRFGDDKSRGWSNGTFLRLVDRALAGG